MQLDQLAHQRQPDAEPALGRAQRAVGLGEQVEHLRQHLRGDADARVAHRDDAPAARVGAALTAMLPPAGVYLIALLRRLTTHCSSRVGVSEHDQRLLGQVEA